MVGFPFKSWETQLSPDQWTQGINKAVQEGYNLIDLQGGLPPEYIAPQIGEARAKGVKVTTTHDYDASTQKRRRLSRWLRQHRLRHGRQDHRGVDDRQDRRQSRTRSCSGRTRSRRPTPLQDAILDYFKENCPACKTKYINTPAAEWATKIQPAVQAALLADPDGQLCAAGL